MEKKVLPEKKLSLYRVRQHFFELRKAGQGAFLLHGRFSLDEGQNVVDERLFNSIAAGIDPFTGTSFSTLATSPRLVNLVLQE